MNDRPRNQRLLADILGEGPAAERREALLGESLRLVRRRRRFRQARRTAYVLALVMCGLLLVRRQGPPGVVPVEQPKPYLLVRTQPLPRMAVVETQPLPAGNMLNSVPTHGILTTADFNRRSREITDDELLALASPAPVVLIRKGPGAAELVFVSTLSDKTKTGGSSPDQL